MKPHLDLKEKRISNVRVMGANHKVQLANERNDWLSISLIDTPIIICITGGLFFMAGFLGIKPLGPIYIFATHTLFLALQKLGAVEDILSPNHMYQYTYLPAISAICKALELILSLNLGPLSPYEIVARIVRTLSTVASLFFIPYYSLEKDQASLLKLLKDPLYIIALLVIASGVSALVMSDVLGTVASVLTAISAIPFMIFSVVIVAWQKRRPNSTKSQVLCMVLTVSISGAGAQIFAVIFIGIQRAMGKLYDPIIGFICVFVNKTLLVIYVNEMMSLAEDRTNEHLRQLFLLLVQLFSELAISIIFGQADLFASPGTFFLLLSLVSIVDLAVESGVLYELWSRKCKKLQTEKEVAIYLGKKYQFIRQKMFVEPLATVVMLLMTTIEAAFGKKLGISIIRNYTGKASSLGNIIGYIVLLIVEVALGQLASRFLKKRMKRIREAVWRELKKQTKRSNNKSIELGGLDSEKLGKSAYASGINTPRSQHPFSGGLGKENKEGHSKSNVLQRQDVLVDSTFLLRFPILHADEGTRRANVIFVESGMVTRCFFVLVAINTVYCALLVVLN
mmetsp:Transcript_18150/g.27238  ORF Transcript_18150/g.27238 Transcript_18150/m.27238 type:complete len:566 (-) Transcript_18150:109-1806(-)|eukprot:CAMPEP_0167756850 /NCGR_PEP_ID=MMETSP0110_2-20121227/9607_1 /TAXON_ID=629695 /ORGANISM="Gymnochlora sp., Strain CCMP2014" /LENGTH=565 /DNA_ID=CAMNT_0007642991 /DNA_START=66 /DNA_END=1763 /DNA_ORIENTATION=+